jgi:hypothetical protein
MDDLLAQLNATSNRITNLLIQTDPKGTIDGVASMHRLAVAQDRIEAISNHLIEERFKLALIDLLEPTAQLDQLNERLDTVAKDINGIKDALDIAGKVIAIVAKVAQTIAAFA